MAFLILLVVLIAATCVTAFRAPAMRSSVAMRSRAAQALHAKVEDQTIQDLNLEQMFDTFEAADKAVKTSDLPKGAVSQYDEKRSVVQDGKEDGSGAPPAAILLGALLGVGIVAFTQLNH